MGLNIELAGIAVEILEPLPYLIEHCAQWQTDRTPEWTITTGPEDLEREKEAAEGDFSTGYLQMLAVLRKFCLQASQRGILLFHASALQIDGKAYLFTAPSGTGKSTHARLWREAFGSRVTMINDDKPLIRLENGRFYAYGTPWNGKHRLSTRTSAEIAGICFLAQGKSNIIQPLNGREALPALMTQIHKPESAESTRDYLMLVSRLAQTVPVWRMECTISPEAAQLSYRTMTGSRTE